METYATYKPTQFDTSGLALEDKQNWLVVIGRNRDSDCRDRSNFRSILKDLGGESESVEVHRFGHWACGWMELIIVKPDTEAATKAEQWEKFLLTIPIADENDLSELEMEEANRLWFYCYNVQERIEYIRNHRSQFDFHNLADMMNCVRGKYFAGCYSELIG